MAFPLVPAPLAFNPDGVLWSPDYRDVYHSCHGGPEQARHVFLGGNDLPARWRGRERFVILETGFGAGLNFLTTWAAWRADPQACSRLHFVSLERHPFIRSDLRQAQARWTEFAPLAAELNASWPLPVPGIHRIRLDGGRLLLTLVLGDARQELRRLMLAADAFYLDGFAPDKNPELWTPEICKAIARLAAPGATLATWSVAGHLRAALSDCEFALEKRPGFAGKRQMLVGRYLSRKPHPYPAPAPAERHVIIIGAGVAGTSVAGELAGHDWQVTLLEARAAPGQGASGNIAGVMRPLPSVDDNFLARLTRAGFLAARAHLERLTAAGLPVRWGTSGALQLARDAEHEAAQIKAARALAMPEEFLRHLDGNAASALLGWPVRRGGWYFPSGGWVQPFSLCAANLLSHPERIHLCRNTPVSAISRANGMWRADDANGKIIARAPHMVMASGVAAPRFAPFSWLPQRSARGQVTWLPAEATPPLDILLCGQGYVTPPVDGVRVVGASYQLDDAADELRLADRDENLSKLEALLPGFCARIVPKGLHGRVGFRPMSPDRLPIVGAVPYAPNAPERLLHHSRHPPMYPGLWCVQGFGSRGIVWSALMADFLVSRMIGAPLPLPHDLTRAIAPERFLPTGARVRGGG
ncbi:MAG: bifunctional tRNA (5-methylaminomethyl-2-thiouridine)(34)-methyltransferase MnmD/FAD-dependent 5-carboxymethylaminomethyl-2-thiouridine(34) oxidoreductase MnmC [Zoogloeaceae bacterium]|jgi:tRNA 5-methylaminomethyl-2-thiouridine biosynthesis bifunctional protein|nr:bifunctional tRNA (5-methylaminomethyl-2-thiouridine)(34)-methyltransferase MnmD/FAD-dependent 5-carboxymethylaminomethyl-2-thiouridine(34) oxidoreductase MnmC [Zoogloeaceae bacterium]